jgi:hypothetical protein
VRQLDEESPQRAADHGLSFVSALIISALVIISYVGFVGGARGVSGDLFTVGLLLLAMVLSLWCWFAHKHPTAGSLLGIITGAGAVHDLTRQVRRGMNTAALKARKGSRRQLAARRPRPEAEQLGSQL